MSDLIPMTAAGFEKLKEKLRQLELEEWPAVIRDIEEARAHGDLSENAEYQYAKDKQGQLDVRIRQLKDRLARAEIIGAEQLKGDTALFGATVNVRNRETEQDARYTLVGPEEADVATGRISILSPIGRAFLGKKRGEIVEVVTPGGTRSFEVLAVLWEAID